VSFDIADIDYQANVREMDEIMQKVIRDQEIVKQEIVKIGNGPDVPPEFYFPNRELIPFDMTLGSVYRTMFDEWKALNSRRL